MKKLICLLMFISSVAFADDLSFAPAYGVNHATDKQLFSFAYSQTIMKELNPWDAFFLEQQATVYGEGTYIFVGSVGLGAEVNPIPGSYVRGTLGISGLSHKTEQLGGNFQFLLKGGAGIRFRAFDQDLRFGPVYMHYSSAGIYERNTGEDFVGFELGLTLPQEYTVRD